MNIIRRELEAPQKDKRFEQILLIYKARNVTVWFLKSRDWVTLVFLWVILYL